MDCVWRNTMVEQEFLDYPCKVCGTLRLFISCLSPEGHWACTDCYYRINNKYMDKWVKVRNKLENKGIRLISGMRLIFSKEAEGI